MHLSQITNIPNLPSTRFNNSDTLVGDVVSRVLLFAAAFAGLIFFVQLITSGFNLMTAAGDPGKIQAAQKSLTNGTIGLVVVISAFFLAQILATLLGLSIL
jgi:hypothetical protein